MCIDYDNANRQIQVSLLPFEEAPAEFTAKELDAINEKIPMTQELYDGIFDKCLVIGKDAKIIFAKLVRDWQYRPFLTVRSDRMATMMGDYDN